VVGIAPDCAFVAGCILASKAPAAFCSEHQEMLAELRAGVDDRTTR
jgi:hypothetical protein